jgi:DNA polymerase/3'-5' exonuclease PolX
MLLDGDEIEKVSARLQFDQHVDIRVLPRGPAGTGSEHFDSQHAHAPWRRQLGPKRREKLVRVGRGEGTRDSI